MRTKMRMTMTMMIYRLHYYCIEVVVSLREGSKLYFGVLKFKLCIYLNL
jgi:hypothetical protein